MIRTNLTKPLLDGLPDEVERYQRTTPIGRVGDPEDIADVVVFLFPISLASSPARPWWSMAA